MELTSRIAIYPDIHTHRAGSPCAVRSISITDRDSLDQSADRPISIGIHPWDTRAEQMQQQIHTFDEMVAAYSPCMIGEAGIDRLRGADIQTQAEALRAQVRTAMRLHLPIVIHNVKASAEIASVLRSEAFAGTIVLHGTSYGTRQLQIITALEQTMDDIYIYVSFGRKFVLDTIQSVPLDRILIESDEDMDVTPAYEAAARALAISADTLATHCWHNLQRIGIAERMADSLDK